MKPIRSGHEVGAGQAGTEPVVRRGRPTGDHAAKRAELLKAAASVIAQEGYANTSLRKVAERAGCTTGAVTYYFAHEEKLVVALAESGATRQAQGSVRDDIPADLLADQLSALGNGWMTTLPFTPEKLAPSRAPAFVDCAMVMISP